MAVRVMGGYDPATGWPVDDSTGVQFNPDVDIPGTFRGGGQGFGPGGFPDSPKLTAPASGPAPGISLSGPGGGATDLGHGDGPAETIFPPKSQNLRPGVSPAIRTGPGPSTDAVFPPPSGRPWWLPNFTPFGLGAAAGGAVLGGIINENQPGNKPAHGTGPPDVMSPEEMYRRTHPSASAPGYRPEDDPRYTVVPSAPYRPEDDPRFTAPNPYGAGMPRGTGSPASAAPPPASAAPPPRPRVPLAAGPAAVAQQPNLGAYSPFTTIDRPNASATGWNPGAPKATALDLSRLFGGGGQPAQVVAAPTPVYKNPSIRQVFPTTPLGQSGIGSDARFPLKKPKSSSSSQRGGY